MFADWRLVAVRRTHRRTHRHTGEANKPANSEQSSEHPGKQTGEHPDEQPGEQTGDSWSSRAGLKNLPRWPAAPRRRSGVREALHGT